MRVVIAGVLGVIPALITPALLYYFDVTPKTAFLLAGCAVLLLFVRRNAANIGSFIAAPLGRWFAVVIAVECASLAASAIAAPDPALATFGSVWRELGVLSYGAALVFALICAAWIAADRGNAVVALRAVAWSGIAGSLYGIAQYLGYDPFLSASGYQAGEGPFTIVRPPGAMGHAGYYAAWLVMVVFSDLALARSESSARARRIALGAAALASFAIVLSGSRAAMLGVVAGLLYLAIRSRRRLDWRMAGACAGCIAVLIAFSVSPLGTRFRARIHWSVDDLRGGARLLLWRDSLEMVRSHPVLGIGPENFVSEFPRSQSVDLARAYPDFYHESPHNAFLDALVSQGMIGLAVLIALCALGVHASRVSTANGATALGAGLIASIVCHQFTVFVPATLLYFLFLAAILTATARPEAPPARPSRVWVWAPACVVLSSVFAYAGMRIVAADHARAVAARLIGARDPWSAAGAYAASLRWKLPGPGWDLAYSRRMSSLASILNPGPARDAAMREALEAARRATTTAEDRQNAYYNLAMLLAARNDARGVEQALRTAIAEAPAWFKPRWALAQLLAITGRRPEAREQAFAAMARDGGKNPEVAATLRRICDSSQ